jgi:hypothetical protein
MIRVGEGITAQSLKYEKLGAGKFINQTIQFAVLVTALLALT